MGRIKPQSVSTSEMLAIGNLAHYSKYMMCAAYLSVLKKTSLCRQACLTAGLAGNKYLLL